MENMDFLPVSRDEMIERGWWWYDFLLVTGDAYVDHPSFGPSVIGRVLEAEGYMSISNNTSGELVVTVKTGPSTYKKNYIYLNSYTLYVVEDITGTHTDPYHYKIYFHTDRPFSVETKP